MRSASLVRTDSFAGRVASRFGVGAFRINVGMATRSISCFPGARAGDAGRADRDAFCRVNADY